MSATASRSPARAARSPAPPNHPPARPAGIHSTRLHAELYSFLLVVTPLIMLRVYLQQFVRGLSDYRLSLLGIEVPTLLVVIGVLGVAALVLLLRKLTKLRLIAGLIVVLMDALAQQLTDYYSAHNFYDIQQNWHYVAYGLFAYMMYRDLEPRGMPMAKYILITFGCALAFSTFDEAFQKYINTRVFDISDIAKDAYGCVAGMVLVILGGRHGQELVADMKHVWHDRLRDYFRRPFTALALVFLFALLLLAFGSILSDDPLFPLAVGVTLGAFVVLLLLHHLARRRMARIVMLSLLGLAIVVQLGFYLRYRDEGITHTSYGLTVYKGIPLPFFDVMIFPGGGIHFVDKKHDFNVRDRTFFLRKQPDILIVTSGTRGRGGNGFPMRVPSQFVWNPFTGRGTHVIILTNDQARDTFNRLKKAGKNVLLVLHNAC